jgi:hypothetical protein
MRDKSGKVATEMSIGVNMDGKETLIPSIVPTLSEEELDHLLKGGKPTPDIVRKATEHAQSRMKQGLGPFAEDKAQPQQAKSSMMDYFESLEKPVEQQKSAEAAKRDYPAVQYGKGLVESALGGLGTAREAYPTSLPGQEERYRREQESPESLIAEAADVGEGQEYFKQTGVIPKKLPTMEHIRKHATHRAEPTTTAEEAAAAFGTGGVVGGVKYALRAAGVPEGLVDSLDLAAAVAGPLAGLNEMVPHELSKAKPTAPKGGGGEPPSGPTAPGAPPTEKLPSLEIPKTQYKAVGKEGEGGLIKAPERTEQGRSLKISQEEPAVGRALTKEKFTNTKEGGSTIQKDVQRLDKQEWEGINKAYDIAELAGHTLDSNRTGALKQLRAYADEIAPIKYKDPAQEALMDAVNTIEKGWKGKPISNKMVHDQMKALRSALKYKFEHGDAKNVFKPAIAILQKELERTSTKQAKTLLGKANEKYKTWIKDFTTPYVESIRDTKNDRHSGIYERSQDIDSISNLGRILSKDKEGNATLSKVKQDYIDNLVSKHIQNGIVKDKKAFNKDLAEIHSILTPEEKKAFDKEVGKYSRQARERKHIKGIESEHKKGIEAALTKAQEEALDKADIKLDTLKEALKPLNPLHEAGKVLSPHYAQVSAALAMLGKIGLSAKQAYGYYSKKKAYQKRFKQETIGKASS